MAKTSSPMQTSVLNHEFCSESVNTQPIEEKQVVSTGNVQNGPGAPGPPIDVASKNQGLEQYGTPNPSQSGHGEKKRCGRPRKGQNTLRASPSSPRVLRSRSQEKPKAPEPSQHLANDGLNREKKKKKKKRVENVPVDEFSRIKRRVRYLLTRMNYEQNLIDAYSGEGWKGQSLEKIKPEKELQRAKSEILRCKLKIRDLFQRLDMSCAEGKLPESLFDSEGEIDSEDIFCAKCGSKELLANNDIILCDGYCERGFHQFCLEPPLLIEDIPPGDEGWLCPGCDCKVDCTDLVNDAHGTNLSISDSWEKVFPEAAASGNNLNDKSEFPSDDSEDDDYNPEGPELDEEEVKGGESSSSDNDSQYFSASDDLGVLPNKDKQYLGLPSDDSEDDDYNPNGKDTDEQARPDGSSSDFTSDSEDFSVAFDDKRISGEVQGGSTFSKSDHIKLNGERSKLVGKKGQSLNDELSSLLESAPGGEGVSTPLGKRHVERLDYKKLHDEAYGNVSSSDSSDEEYTDTDVPKRRRKSETGKGPSLPPNRKLETDSQDMKDKQKDNESTPKTGANKLPDVEDTSNIPAESNKGSIGPHSRGGGTRSAYKRLGEATTQRLLEAFRENQYPDRPMKENLANELSITFNQVSKWFENCRRPSSRVGSSIAESASNKDTQIDNDPPVTEPEMLTENCSGNVKATKSKGKVNLDNQTDPILLTCEGNGQNSKTPNSKLGKVMIEDQTDPILGTEEGNGQNSRILNSEKRKVKIDNQTNPTLASKEGDGQNSKTPKSTKRKEKIENQTEATWVTEESSGQNSKTPKSNKKVKMDNQTDPTCVTEEANGTNSKTPKSEKKKDELDNQTNPTLVTEQGIGLKSKTPKSRKREVKIDNKTDPTFVTEEGNGQNSRTATSGKRKGYSDNKKDPNLGVEEEIQEQNAELVNSAKAKEVRRSGRIQSKKSVA